MLRVTACRGSGAVLPTGRSASNGPSFVTLADHQIEASELADLLFMTASHSLYSLYVNTQGTPGG